MTNTETALTLAPAPAQAQQLTAFASESSFEAAQRMAKALCSSNLVPANFQGQANIGSALIALEIAQRLGASPLMVMQNLNVIHGRPAWSSQFIIAALNSCGRFSPLRFDVTGDGDVRSCTAWAYDRASGDRLDGPAVSIATAKKEGWFGKNGSKWQTMPELMLRYRAAAFFGRLYAPDILMGMQSAEEITDTRTTTESPRLTVAAAFESTENVDKTEPTKRARKKAAETPAPVIEVVESITTVEADTATDGAITDGELSPATATEDSDNDIFG